MATIDERVVSMKFDNKQFEGGIAGTLKSLSNLKEKLQLPNATKGLEDVDSASKKISFAGLASGIEGISGKFVALGTVAITTLTNITNRAVDAGFRLAKSFTTDPIMDGFREYELKMGSIQTILANTSRHGTTLEEVTTNLDALNEYADKTIYNFGDMTRNIGLFTNAGIKVDEATSMIKGFSNEAAASGTNAQGAASAAYQLSQALSAGTIRLMDWRSLQNVGMGNKNMQLSLIEIAQAMGTLEEAGVSAETVQQDFNGSLEEGWLSADVMSSYLKIMAGDMSETEMASMGLSQEVIEGFKKQQQTGEEAATKVRTFTQLMDTMKEAVGSSWSETFDIILGDFEVATDLFTGINDAISPLIDKMGDARNKLLQGWADEGGRTALFGGIVAAFEALQEVMGAVGKAFRDIFPPITATNLVEISLAISEMLVSLIPGEETLEKIRRIFRGVFAVLDIGRVIVVEILKVFQKLFYAVNTGSGGFLDIAASIGDFLVAVRNAIREGQFIEKLFQVLGTVIAIPIKGIGLLVGALMDLAKGFSFGDAINKRIEQLGEFGEVAARIFDILFKGDYTGGPWEEDSKFVDFLFDLREGFLALLEIVPTVWNILFKGEYGGAWEEDSPIVDFLFKVREAFADFFNSGNFNSLLDLFNTGFIVGLVVLVKKFLNAFEGGLDSADGFVDTIKDAIGGVTDTMSAMQTSLKADALLKIAGAIAILAASIVVLSMIDSDRLTSALTAITVSFGQLGAALYMFQTISTGPGVAKLPVVAAGLTLLGGALLIFSASVKVLSTLSWEELLKGLSGLVVMLGALVGTVKLMNGMGKGMVTAGAGLILLATSIRILVDAVRQFGEMDWGTIVKGLVGVAGLLVSLAIFTKISEVNGAGIRNGVGLVLLAAALNILLGVVRDLGSMDLPSLTQGLVAMAAALMAIGVSMNLMPQNMALTGAGLVVVASALLILTNSLMALSQFSIAEVATSLIMLAGSMLVLAGGLTLMTGTVPGSMALMVASAALAVLTPVLMQLASLGWGELAVGLTALAGSLIVIAGSMIAMAAALPGAAALVVVAGALAILTPVLVTLSGFTWGELGMGLLVLASSLGALALTAVLLSPFVPALIALAAAITLFGAGIAIVGVGVLAFATGLSVLAAAGAAAGVGLSAFITSIVNVVPTVVAAFTATLISLAAGIQTAAPAIVGALVEVLNQLLQAIVDLSPGIAAAFTALIDLLVTVVHDNFPKLVQAGWDLLITFLDGIANNIGQVIEKATDIIVAFLDGIDNSMPRILDKGSEVIINFVNSLANTIESRSGEMREAAGRLGLAIMDGLTGGIASKSGEVFKAIGDVAGGAINFAKGILNINSPSKEFHEIGAFSSMGLANGISALAGLVKKASGGVARTALDTMRNSLSNVGSVIGDDISLNPHIKPVVDLSDVHKGAREVSNAFDNPKVSLGHSFDLAKRNMDALRVRDGRESSKETPQPVNNTFVQNNYSPKELSPSEIYRQTNTLLAMKERSL